MINVDINHVVPKFLLEDKNGYALAKALEKGLQMFCDILQEGIDTVLNVEKMPEWRLDEMAWELNCLYDFDAPVETKRVWIRDAIPLYASYGTVAALYKYLEGYFDEIEVEENWQYEGDPFHFRVTVSGEWTDKKERWARLAAETIKNVRSVVDDISIGSRTTVSLKGETAWWRFPYRMTDTGTMTGTVPLEAMVGRVTEGGITAQTEAAGYRFLYELTGTIPQENTAGKITDQAAYIQPEAETFRFPYGMPLESYLAGTRPQEAVTGKLAEGSVSAKADAEGHKFPYEITGTIPQENTAFSQGGAAATAHSDAEGTVFSYPQTGGNTFCGNDDL